MKRLALILGLILVLALTACDTMGPQGTAATVVGTTEGAPADATGGEVATAVPAESGEEPAEGAEGSSDVAGADLLGVTWEWVSLLDPAGQTAATDPVRYTITFNADGTANWVADCNTATANYITDGVNLNIELGATSLVACPADTQDQLFLNSLSAAESYVVQDSELFITMVGDSGTLIFRSAGSGGAAETPESAPVLTGVTWEWAETTTMVGTTAAADPTRYTILFNDDGTANIKADCNTVLANYTTDDAGALTLTLGPSTLAACPPDSQVNDFLAGLAVVGGYSFDGADLLLTNPAADGGVMRFRAAGAGEPGTVPPMADTLTGVTWEWTGTTTPVEEITVADPTRYTITFNEDGTAGIVADCNVGGATYTTGEGGTIAITLGVSTLAFCENSQDQQFREGLSAAAVYFFQDGQLNIDLFASAGTMHFRAAGGAVEPETAPPTGDTLTGVTWQWVSTTTPVEVIASADPTRYTITFNEDGTANIVADCNVGGATYTAGEDGSLAITLGVSTLAFCENSQDQQFRNGLAAAANYFFQDGNLYIDMIADGGTMLFAPAGATGEDQPDKGEGGVLAPTGDLVGTTWQWTLLTKTDGNITVNDPTRYTLTFNADGTANIQADCNQVTAGYTTGDGNSLTITLGASTAAFCGPGSLDQIFIGGLANAMSYRIEEGNLIIDMLYESGSLVFSPAS